MTADKLLELFERMYNEHWSYKWGAAEEGCVDCSGAFVWAFSQVNKTCPHGSNAMARNMTTSLMAMNKAQPGMVAYKLRTAFEDSYDLPAKYQEGGKADNGDYNDYYHVGLVDASGCYVLNAQSTSTGFVRSKISAGWDACGYLTGIDYTNTQTDGDVASMTQMMVTASSGSTVNRRVAPKAGAALLDRIKIGTVVTVVATDGTWSTVQYDGVTGYMMSQYLTELDSTDTTTETDTTLAELLERVQKLEERVQALEGGVG